MLVIIMFPCHIYIGLRTFFNLKAGIVAIESCGTHNRSSNSSHLLWRSMEKAFSGLCPKEKEGVLWVTKRKPLFKTYLNELKSGVNFGLKSDGKLNCQDIGTNLEWN